MESWVLYSLIALFAFGVANFLVEFVSSDVPIPLLGLVYSAATLATLAAIFFAKKPEILFPGNSIYLLIVAGILLGMGVFAALTAFSLGLGSKVVTIFNMNTIVTVALLILIVGEKITPKIGLGIGFALLSLYLLTS